MKRRIPIHLKAILTLLVAIFVFSVVVPQLSAAIPGQLYGWYVVTTPWPTPLRGSMLAKDTTNPTLGNRLLAKHLIDAGATSCGA